MNKQQLNNRLRRLMYKEINEMCARYTEECGEVITHFETQAERAIRLKKAYYDKLRKERYQLGGNNNGNV